MIVYFTNSQFLLFSQEPQPGTDVLSVISLIVGIVGVLLTVAVPIFASWWKDHKDKSTYNERKERAHREIVSVIATNIAESDTGGTINIENYKSIVRTKAIEHKVDIDFVSEIGEVIDSLKSQILGNCFIKDEDKTTQISRVEALEAAMVPDSYELEDSLVLLAPILQKKVKINWFNIIIQSFFWFIIAVGLTLLWEVIYISWSKPNFAGIEVAIFYTVYPITIGVLSAILVGKKTFNDENNKKLYQEAAIDYYAKTVYATIKNVLSEHNSSAELKRDCQIMVNADTRVVVDKVLLNNDERIPIDIRYEEGRTLISDIKNSMQNVNATKGIVFSYKKVSNGTKLQARSESIIIRDNFTSKQDITDVLMDNGIIRPIAED